MRITASYYVLTGILLWPATSHAQTRRAEEVGPYSQLVERHLRELAATGTDVYGPVTTPMWMSVVDTRTGRPPEKPHTPQRVYRQIGAPQGTTLYWDQALVVAAYELSRLTGKPAYQEAAASYIDAFLDRCVDQRGMFEWGNHEYYDAVVDDTVRFQSVTGDPPRLEMESGVVWQLG
jgi:hypothetical protein